MVNSLTLIGRLGQDAELKTLESGIQYTKFSLATANNFKNQSGEWQTETTWHPCVAWRDLATRHSALKKGDLIYVDGEVQLQSYTDEGGKKHTRYSVTAKTIKVMERKEPLSTNEPVPPPQYAYDKATSPLQQSPEQNIIQDESGLPF